MVLPVSDDGAEADDRVRLAHAGTNDKATLKRFAD
jgi:hypothetical protein